MPVYPGSSFMYRRGSMLDVQGVAAPIINSLASSDIGGGDPQNIGPSVNYALSSDPITAVAAQVRPKNSTTGAFSPVTSVSFSGGHIANGNRMLAITLPYAVNPGDIAKLTVTLTNAGGSTTSAEATVSNSGA